MCWNSDEYRDAAINNYSSKTFLLKLTHGQNERSHIQTTSDARFACIGTAAAALTTSGEGFLNDIKMALTQGLPGE